MGNQLRFACGLTFSGDGGKSTLTVRVNDEKQVSGLWDWATGPSPEAQKVYDEISQRWDVLLKDPTFIEAEKHRQSIHDEKMDWKAFSEAWESNESFKDWPSLLSQLTARSAGVNMAQNASIDWAKENKVDTKLEEPKPISGVDIEAASRSLKTSADIDKGAKHIEDMARPALKSLFDDAKGPAIIAAGVVGALLVTVVVVSVKAHQS